MIQTANLYAGKEGLYDKYQKIFYISACIHVFYGI